MNLRRCVQMGCILLMTLLALWLQVSPALSQTRDISRYQLGEAELPALGLHPLLPQPETVHEGRYQRALADYKAGELKQAAQELRTLHSAIARNALGVVLEAMGNHAGARMAFQDALRLQPDFADAAFNAAKLMIQDGRPNAAIYQLQSTLKAHGIPGSTRFSLEMLLIQAFHSNKQDKRATQILERLVAERPDSADLHINLALMYTRLGMLNAAVKQYHEGLLLKPQDCAGLMGLAITLLKLKKDPVAAPYLKEYVRLQPDDAYGYYVLGCALSDMGHYKEAVAELSKAAHLSPEDFDIRNHLGVALLQTGQLEAALSQLEAAERLNPNKVRVHSALARVLWLLDRKGEAQKESAWAERLSLSKHRQDRASYCLARGNLLLGRGDLEGAAKLFRQALQINPENARARTNLGLVLARLNDPRDSRRELEKAVAEDPNLAVAYNALGISEWEDGQVSEAEVAFQKAIKVDPQYAEAKTNLGTLYAKLGKSSKAVAFFQQAIEDSPQYPQSYLNWGLVLASQGNLSKAKEMLEKALQISPNLARARKALEMIQETQKKSN